MNSANDLESEQSNYYAKTSFWKKIPNYFLLIAFVLVFLLFGIIEPKFFKINNVMEILRTSSITALLACGAMMVMPTGDINFACGAQMTLAAALFGRLMMIDGLNTYWLSVPIVLILSILVGVAMAFFVVRLHVPAFICTLGFSSVLYGICMFLTGNTNLYSNQWPGSFTFIGQGKLFNVIPYPVVVMIVVCFIAFYFMEYTRSGRHLYATGANLSAAQHVGINVVGTQFLAYILCAVLCCTAGIVNASLSNLVAPNMGDSLQMPALTAAMLGAAFWKIGRYNVPGTVLAAVLIVTIQNGVVAIGGSYSDKDIAQGIVLIIALIIIALTKEGGLPDVKFTR